MKWNLTLVILVVSISVILTTEMKESESGEEEASEKGKKKGGGSDMKKAKQFMMKVNKIQLQKMHESSVATFNHTTNLTNANKEIKNKAGADLNKFMKKIAEKAKKFDWKSFKEKNSTLYRWFEIMISGNAMEDSPMDMPLLFRSDDTGDQMEEIFENAKMCPYNQPNKPCTLTFDPDVIEIMANSRNYDELKNFWKQFRDQTGKKIRKLFIENVKENNKEAKAKGYKDYVGEQLAPYESKTIQEDMAKIMKKILPLYKQLHAYVRLKLRKYYKKNAITKDGPIPAHILGDMYAQKWRSIYSIVNPYPKQSAPNVTASMKKKKMKPIDMFMMAEKFFVSIGLKKMTPYFWHFSMIEKPKDGRKVECHGTAYDMHNDKDYRIKMCSTVNEEIFETIHHEMGHIQYYMHYNNLPGAFQEGANPGFHEAIGDSMSLSVQTPDYLKKIGLLQKNETGDSENYEISYLIRVALTYLSGVPYAYIIDHWRNRVYNGTIKDSELNKKYWEDRLYYQGVCPPVKRTEKDFDIGAKYHIPNNIEYMRYFFSNVFQFQIHKILCKEAGHKGPLFQCNIYENKKAGEKFAKMLKLGCSQPWQKTMSMFTGGKTKKLDPEPILEFFEPLLKWLKKENKNNHIGWKSKNPMECPES